MSLPGTQAYAPLIENITHKKLPIAFSVASKHCSQAIALKKKGIVVECPHHDGSCTATWPENAPMSSVESHLASGNAAFLKHVKIDKLCTDNDSKIINGTRQVFPEAEKMDCTVHVSRGQRRLIYRCPFSEAFYKSYRVGSKSNVNRIVVNAVAKRCTAELQKARAAVKVDADLLKAINYSKENIVKCLSGNHTKCRHTSFVCKGTRMTTKCILETLPEQRWLVLSEKDKCVMLKLLEYKLCPDMVLRQRDLLNTNKSEATHLRVFKSLPKSNTWVRNYEGRAHSAIHSASGGMTKSLREINEIMGVPMNPQSDIVLQKIDQRDAYLAGCKKSHRYKVRRKYVSQRKEHLKCAYSAGYKSGMMHPTVRKDHDYSRK